MAYTVIANISLSQYWRSRYQRDITTISIISRILADFNPSQRIERSHRDKIVAVLVVATTRSGKQPTDQTLTNRFTYPIDQG
ncbi:MAG: hypothetical protein BWY21_00059 [Parcubacteria group bacterium ADurb.Bin216]|nr:MAG: hypothetical protein BWY21_00059 [Parcubacteria group bacterium ADurb.Bin216]